MGTPEPRPFRIEVPQERLDAIRDGVARFRWDALADAGCWDAGVGLADVRRLAHHWLHRYDWRAAEARLNATPQFRAEADGVDLHFVHLRGDGSRLPLMVVHGWPGSFTEFLDVAGPLVKAGHDVVLPSLPGYAFSGRPAQPVGPRGTAGLFHRLMTEALGYRRYGVQGGDWGAHVACWMARDHAPACAATHLNMVSIQAEDATPRTAEDLTWAAGRAEAYKAESGYAHQQETRPQTLGFAMLDSPVGVAAWITEKFGMWSDLPRRADGTPDLWATYDEDWLLTNVMLRLVTDAFPTSTWMYRGRVLEGSGAFPAGARVDVPTAVAAFPDPVFACPPRSQVEKTYAVARWTEPAEGGHFAARERPAPWLDDVRAFFADRR